MKPSYNRVFLKPTLSKKNPAICSILAKEHNEPAAQGKESKVMTRRDRVSRNSNNSIYDNKGNAGGIKSKNNSKVGSK